MQIAGVAPGGAPKGAVVHDPHVKAAAALMASDYDFLWLAPPIRSKLIQAIAAELRRVQSEVAHAK